MVISGKEVTKPKTNSEIVSFDTLRSGEIVCMALIAKLDDKRIARQATSSKRISIAIFISNHRLLKHHR